eukprot:UC1_evm1s483
MESDTLSTSELYCLLAGQLRHDGHAELATAVLEAGCPGMDNNTTTITTYASPSARLAKLVELGRTVERNVDDFAGDASYGASATMGTAGGDGSDVGEYVPACLNFDSSSAAPVPPSQAAYSIAETVTQRAAGMTACFSPDGQPLVAVGAADGRLCVYGVPNLVRAGSSGTFAPRWSLNGHRTAVRSVALHPQSKFLASCGRDLIMLHDLTRDVTRAAHGPYRTIK